MQAHPSLSAGLPRGVRLLLEAGWLVILVKCAAVPWVITRWQIPVHPGWVIVPTVIFGVLVTAVALAWPRE